MTMSDPAIPSYRLLGSSSLRVSPICLGTMQFGESDFFKSFGCYCEKDTCEQVYKSYIEHGGNFVDTANFYQLGQSEQYVGEFMQKYNNLLNRDELVLATKYSLLMTNGPNGSGNHKKNMVQSLTKSLERLNTPYIDIMYVHYWDYTMETEQLMRALDDLVRSGKVLHVAISDTPAWEVSRANTIAQLRGWSPFVCYQGRYSLIDRAVESDVLPMCNKMNLGFVPWAVVGQGKLTGKFTRQGASSDAQRKVASMSETEFLVQDEVIKIAKELNKSPAQVATAWILQQQGVSSALIGPSKLAQLQEAMDAVHIKLTSAQIQTLNEVSKNCPGKFFPQSFVQDSYKTNPWLYGGPAAKKKFLIE